MPTPVTDLSELLRKLRPALNPGGYVFRHVPDGAAVPREAVGFFREAEGISVIVPADASGTQDEMAWITLTVHSSLSAVGLTAVVATALAAEGISCNVVAAFHHDHLFVPAGRASDAMRVLQSLQLKSTLSTDEGLTVF